MKSSIPMEEASFHDFGYSIEMGWLWELLEILEGSDYANFHDKKCCIMLSFMKCVIQPYIKLIVQISTTIMTLSETQNGYFGTLRSFRYLILENFHVIPSCIENAWWAPKVPHTKNSLIRSFVEIIKCEVIGYSRENIGCHIKKNQRYYRRSAREPPTVAIGKVSPQLYSSSSRSAWSSSSAAIFLLLVSPNFL